MSSSNFFDEFGKFLQATTEFFVSAASSLVAEDGQKSVQQAGWKAYDSWVRMTNEATNALYAEPLVIEVTSRTLETGLRWQRVGSAMAGAFFSALWPAVGLPTAEEVSGLRGEVRAMRDQLSEATLGARQAELSNQDAFRQEAFRQEAFRQEAFRSEAPLAEVNGFRATAPRTQSAFRVSGRPPLTGLKSVARTRWASRIHNYGVGARNDDGPNDAAAV